MTDIHILSPSKATDKDKLSIAEAKKKLKPCPICGSEWDFCDNDTHRFEYCPRCGADLREKKR